MNDKEQIKIYLEKLTGQSFNNNSYESLSSAQRARFQSWLNKKNISIDGIIKSKNLKDNKNKNNKDYYLKNGVGIDIQNIEEFSKNYEDFLDDANLKDVFTLSEINYAKTKSNMAETLCGLFAAKEAIIKSGYSIIKKMNEIEITHEENGRPKFMEFNLSISHSKNYCIAVATANSKKDSNILINNDSEIKKNNYFSFFIKFLFFYLTFELLKLLML